MKGAKRLAIYGFKDIFYGKRDSRMKAKRKIIKESLSLQLLTIISVVISSRSVAF